MTLKKLYAKCKTQSVASKFHQPILITLFMMSLLEAAHGWGKGEGELVK